MSKLMQVLIARNLQLAVPIVLVVVAMMVLSPYFMTTQNIINLSNQIAINLIIAAGMTLLITSGGIDLSVGSTVGLSSVAVAVYFQNGYSDVFGPYGAVLVGLMAGAVVGLVNGVLVAILGIPAFIATLGTMIAGRGLVFVFSGGRAIMGMDQTFLDLFSGFAFHFPKPVMIALLAAAIAGFILNSTITGRLLQGLGGNERCLYAAGIRVRSLKIGAYVMMGVLAGLAGLTLTSTLAASEPFAGTWYELEAIAVVVMGGTLLSGGRGTVTGTMLGALLLGLVSNAINLLGINANYQTFIVGAMIFVAIVLGSPVLSAKMSLRRH
jgi:ribose transport system permease protein